MSEDKANKIVAAFLLFVVVVILACAAFWVPSAEELIEGEMLRIQFACDHYGPDSRACQYLQAEFNEKHYK